MRVNCILDVQAVMQSLSVKRPIFHSEADFQHALAWELQSEFPKASIRLVFQAVGVAVPPTMPGDGPVILGDFEDG